MKIFILYLLRSLGFFKLSKCWNRKKLLILAYHGVEINDESSFNPHLFIKRPTFERRMEYLKKEKFNVLGLSKALHKLHTDNLPRNTVVITFDDGWYSTMYHAADILSKNTYPYTIYVTSYYVIHHEVPVLNVVLQYMLWSCSKHTINLDLLAMPELSGTYSILDTKEKNDLYEKLFKYFNSIETTNQKKEFVKKLSFLLEMDYKKIETGRNLGLLSFSELKNLSDQGVDIQLHTHRHSIPFDDIEKIKNEINENRLSLMPYVKNRLEHFCYPSGKHYPICELAFQTCGVSSATTSEPGLVTKQTNIYYLPRFLDGENIPQIVFEAELCGVLNLLRKIRLLAKSIDYIH
jgi:peptidoglycan/xylan/chitin deacetylase (PgdA/CDA1 family)